MTNQVKNEEASAKLGRVSIIHSMAVAWALCLALCFGMGVAPVSYAEDICFACMDPDSVVKFDANGGSGGGEYYAYAGYTLKKVGYKSLPKATRKGYKFKGWYTKKSGGTKVTINTKVKKWSVTFYAHWTAKKYTIKIKRSGKGTVSGGGTKAYNSKVTLKAKPASGYTFKGWYLNGDLMSTSKSWTIKVPLNGATYTAKFSKK